ncbi:hypothetical protein [Burkholderia seminalis]|nr:hypothetical protein [Burkholderia seminalis]VWB12805.1 hypothetical protein BSE24067_00414 [Burkholderia seminalis]
MPTPNANSGNARTVIAAAVITTALVLHADIREYFPRGTGLG